MPHILAFTGRLQEGKTTAAKIAEKILREQNPNSSIILLPFAQPIKDLAKLIGWNGEKDEKGRKLLQILGTDIGRNLIDKDIWVKKWWESVKDYDFIICDDLRFNSEAEFLVAKNAFIVKVEGRKKYGLWFRLKLLLGLIHESERGLKKEFVDRVIFNDSCLTELEEDVELVIEIWRERFN